MSIRVMTQVWENSMHSGTELLMLLALADFSDDEGSSYPAVPTLAAKCRMRPRNAGYILKALTDSGELQVRPNEGPKGTNRYRIVVRPLQHSAGVQRSAGVVQPIAPPAPATDCTTPAIHGRLPLQPIADEPSLNQEKRERTRHTRSIAETLLPRIDPDLLVEWQAVRKSKRAAGVSKTVVNILKREAVTAGISAEKAIEACIEFNWQNFNAGWYAERGGKNRPTDIYAGAV